MNDDVADLKRFFQPHILPTFAAVGGFVDAVAVRHWVTRVVFPGADPNDIGIGGRHADIAYRDCCFTIELVLESDAVVNRLQQTSGSSCDPVGGGIGFIDGDSDNAAAHSGRPDAAPSHRLDPLRRNGAGFGGRVIAFRLLQVVQFFVELIDLLLNVGDLLFPRRLIGP